MFPHRPLLLLLLLICKTTTKEDNTLLSFLFPQTQRRQNTHKKTRKKTKRREGAYFQAPVLPFHFWLSLLPFCFKRFFLASSSSQAEEKKKKTIKKKRNAKKGRNFPSSSCFSLSFLAPTSALPILPFCFKRFLMASFYSQTKEKKTHTKKKNHRKEKKMQKREGAFL